MSLWTLLPVVLGLLGVSGGVAFLFLGGGGFLALAGFLRFVPTPAQVWRFLTSPMGLVFTMVALSGGFWLAGDVHGKRAGRAECERRIEQSRADAKAADARITAEAQARADAQRGEAAARETAIQTEVKGYVEELAKRTGEACRAGDDAARFNDGLDLRDDERVPGADAPAPARGGRRPDAGSLPKGKGK